VDLRFEAHGLEVDYYWAWAGEFPQNVQDYVGAFLSGSPYAAYDALEWVHRECKLIHDLVEHGVPILGSCFGSQLLAFTLCGSDQVFKRNVPEVGYKWVDLLHPPEGDELLQNLPNRVFMFVYHHDEVKADHPDICIRGSDEVTPNQIWRYKSLPVWGIQGHPEFYPEQALTFFDRIHDDLVRDGVNVDDLISKASKATEATKLIQNFIEYCAQYNRG